MRRQAGRAEPAEQPRRPGSLRSRASRSSNPASDRRSSGLTATSTAAFWRSRYYRRRDYQPMWWGTHDPFWDDYGYRWYDDDRDDDDGGGFGDS